MRKRDRKALGEYMRDIADKLELRDWTISLERTYHRDEDGPDRSLASVHCVTGRKLACITVHEGFRDWDVAKQRHVVVHELVHCHLHALQEQAENDLHDLVGKPVDTVFCRSLRRNLEYAVDALAEALARHLPLIEWPK